VDLRVLLGTRPGMFIRMDVCMYVLVHVCMYVRTYLCVCAYLCMCECICMYVCMYECMYVCILLQNVFSYFRSLCLYIRSFPNVNPRALSVVFFFIPACDRVLCPTVFQRFFA